ncbi:hypothetical protein SteCoe_32234 [Stentor coeruleus]|uniref:Uncharacterized protein n=1 Tax=Stentor coeruleus TaxID=5963 RepID=A0A1R2AZH6_9CILI|nr:hypothetical protein SteCoe_32234 [Stentor coeruleus]
MGESTSKYSDKNTQLTESTQDLSKRSHSGLLNYKPSLSYRSLENHICEKLSLKGFFLYKALQKRLNKKGQFIQFLEENFKLIIESNIVYSWCIAITKDYNKVITAGKDRNICIFDLRLKVMIATLRGHRDSVTCIEISESEKILVSGSYDCTVAIWSLKHYTQKFVFSGHNAKITVAKISHNEKIIISGSDDCAIVAWDNKKREKIGIMFGHLSPITALAITHDDRYLVSSSGDEKNFDCSIRIWNLNTLSCIGIFIGHCLTITSLQISKNNKLFSSSLDSSIHIWDLKKLIKNVSLSNFNYVQTKLYKKLHILIRLIIRTEQAFRSWFYIQDDSSKKKAKIDYVNKIQKDYKDKYLIEIIKLCNCEIFSIKLIDNGKNVLIGLKKSIAILNLTKREKEIFSLHNERDLMNNPMKFEIKDFNSFWVMRNKEEYSIFSLTKDAYQFYSLNDHNFLSTLKFHEGNVNAVTLTPNGKFIISSDRSRIVFWNLRKKQYTSEINFKNFYKSSYVILVLSMCVTYDSNHLLMLLLNGDIMIWNIKHQKLEYLLSENDIKLLYINYLFRYIKFNSEFNKEYEQTKQYLLFCHDFKKSIVTVSDDVIQLWNINKKIKFTIAQRKVKSVCITKGSEFILLEKNNNYIEVIKLKGYS